MGLLVVLSAVGAAAAKGEPQIVERQGSLASISGLHRGEEDCVLRPMAGKVVKRAFDTSELVPTGIILERRDGTRMFVGIELDQFDDRSENAKRELLPALQRLTKPGRRVSGRIVTRGNAEINTVETIR
jgi:hypothetical protein